MIILIEIDTDATLEECKCTHVERDDLEMYEFEKFQECGYYNQVTMRLYFPDYSLTKYEIINDGGFYVEINGMAVDSDKIRVCDYC